MKLPLSLPPVAEGDFGIDEVDSGDDRWWWWSSTLAKSIGEGGVHDSFSSFGCVSLLPSNWLLPAKYLLKFKQQKGYLLQR